jgi:hypothetical protein
MVPDIERKGIAEESCKPVRLPRSVLLGLGLLVAVILWICGGC